MGATHRKLFTGLSRTLPALLFCVLAAAHGVFAWENRDRRPDLTIIEPPPSARESEVMSFGDHQFLYRAFVLDLQNAGDTGGRATPMRDYNYDYVLGWLQALQYLDYRAHHHVLLAVRYFSWSPDPAVIRRLVEFIAADVSTCPDRKWYWLTQTFPLALHRLNDPVYALVLARQLASYDYPDMPTWTWLFPGILLHRLGRDDEARAVMEDVKQRKAGVLTKEDLHWVTEFEQKLYK